MQKISRLLLLPVLLFALGQQLHAQIKVEMGYERRLFVLYEPIPVTVTITNLTGHELELQDSGADKWFSFQVTTGETNGDARVIPPLDVDYKIPGLRIPAGATVKRTVDLSRMYSVQDPGIYRLRASVYSQEAQKYFSSGKDELEVSEGKTFWEQTVGVPQTANERGDHRTFSLMTFRQPKYNVLYVRVQDKDSNTIYTTAALGPLIAEMEPDYKLDKNNTLHVLQLVGPRVFLYSRVSLDGVCDQLNYYSVNTRPVLRKDPQGEVIVFGGTLNSPDNPAPSKNGPKVSDRPPGFTSTDGTPAPH